MFYIKTTSFSKYQTFLFYKTLFFRFTLSTFFIFYSLILKMKYQKSVVFPYFFFLPTHISKFTILRSPHIHKKSREQFEYRLHNSLFVFDSIFNSAHDFAFTNCLLIFKNLLYFQGVTNILKSANYYYSPLNGT